MPGVVAPLPQGKSNHFGLEVSEKVVWQGWEPGREYTRNIVLKNVKVKTQKLKYRGPGTRFFSTLYPQPIVLSAGTSFTLPVTFRPLEKVVYDDKVEFDTFEGQFDIPIKAVLPVVDIEVPEHINFNMCAALDYRQLSFEIKNVSELETPFQIECRAPFHVSPPEGVMEPYSTVTITVTFTPQAAVGYEADTVIKYGPEFAHAKITRFEGIGKYPHLMVRGSSSQPEARGATETVVQFGRVSIGKTVDKWIELHNMSPVNAPFTVEHPVMGAGRLDAVFQCLQKEGVVPAMSSCRIPVSFSPNTVGAKSVDYFHVKAIGNISKTVVTCIGSSSGPCVSLSKNLINFVQIDAGQVATKTVDIINQSETEAVFQFQLDCCESVFKFEHLSGVLPPNSKRTVIVQFQPVHPINYYRKITCLVHNQDPLFLDLLGTCHTETTKPSVLQAKHLQRYKLHVDRGLSFTPPEQLNDQLRDGKLKLDGCGALYKEEENKETDLDKSVSHPPALNPMDEYFNDGYYSDFTHLPPHVSFDVHQTNFGQVTDLKSTEKQTVNVTNHTNGKITVVWMGDASHIFSVTPMTLDIPPLGSSSFSVSFRPNCPNQFFGSELECYAYYKSLRDYRLVEDTTHCPPWCMTVVATGHTFQPHNETFLPRYILDTPDLTFPAVNAHEATYRTLLLSNTGTTPILFDFDKDQDGIFSLKPTMGLLPANENQLFIVKCLPKAVKLHKSILKLHLNAAEKNDQDVTMLGSAESAEVLLGEDGVMYFKPTCIGTASTRQYSIKNISRMPLNFEWKMAQAEADLLTVAPSSGLIQPNENQYHTWSFMPKTEKQFVMKPTLVVWGQGLSTKTSGGKQKQFPVRVIGEGSLGEIKCEKSYIQFGNIVVGSQAVQEITVTNDSDCNLEFQLSVDQEIEGPYQEQETRHDPLALILEKTQGILPARSREVICCTARPSRRTCYRWTVSYRLCTQHGDDLDPTLTEERFMCHVLATGVFPTMSISDAHCYGSAIGISKKQLWSLFSLDNLNTAMDADPSAAELMYTVATRQSHRRRAPVYTRSILDFNFSAAPLHSDPCVVQLMLENTGAVPCEWSFLFPNDLQLELEYWAETGDFDEEELHQLKVMDNKLFLVEPKKGRMEPGECQTITFTYNHIMAGTDRLPVLLKLARGREILLNFVGVTVEPDRRYLHFPSSSFMFSPVAIGEKNSPKQIYELYNGGALPVKYEFDVVPLEFLKQENYDHNVFEVMNPMGEVLPGQTMAVEWKFSPLEAKTYMVDLPIHIHNGDTAMVTFTGVGYDKRALGDTMPITDNHEVSGVPSVQSVPLPGQLSFLSQERVSFGNIPLFTRPRQIVIISNKSLDHGVIFRWHVTSQNDSKIVSIHPKCGRLPPGGAHICNVTFVSFGFPAFYDIDMICEVTNLTDYDNYEHELKNWTAEKERQQVEFAITKEDSVINLTEFKEYERKLQAWSEEKRRQTEEFSISEDNLGAESCVSHSSSSKAGSRPPSGKLQSLEAPRTPSPETDLAKYKTLPPIRQYAIDQQRDILRAQKRFEDKFWACPQPPKPFLLHLGVTARTHNVSDFQQNFPDEYQKFCIDRTLCDPASEDKDATATFDPQPTSCLAAEADLVAGAITNILRGLLDDTQFQESCHKVINAPVPYFKQFSTKPPVTAPPATAQTEGSILSDPAAVQLHAENSSPPPASPQDSVGDRLKSSQSQLEAEPEPEVEAELVAASSRASSQLPEVSYRSQSQTSEQRFSAARGSAQRPESGLEDAKFAEKQTLKKVPEFTNAVESLIEDTLGNILQEAFAGEFNITARPRLIALLPKSNSAASHHK